MLEILLSSEEVILLTSLTNNVAPQSSIRGIVSRFNGPTLVFACSKFIFTLELFKMTLV